MPSEMNKMLYGPEIAQKMAALDEALAEIDNKHRAYFDSMKSRYAKEEENIPSKLSEFTLIQWNSHGASMDFPYPLRPDIVEECKAAFRRVVG